MAKADILSVLYARSVSPMEFDWDRMISPPLLNFLTYQDIYQLYSIAMSNKLASKPKEKYKMIDNIVKPRGFRKIASGTNRVVYKFIDDQRYCIKIAYDRVGILNNPMEYMNQYKLKPFVAKVFDVSPCGTVALCERVEPIVTREEFANIAGDIYDLIVNKIIGKFVVDDIGSDYFQNYGIRLGVCPVLLDYPSVYELDGRKLYCNRLDPDTKIPCMGAIDYDAGFNKLICSKCGKEYHARQLGKQEQNGNIIVKMEGVPRNMSIKLYRGDKVERIIETNAEMKTVPEKKPERRDGIRLMNTREFNKRAQNKRAIEEDRAKRIEEAKVRNEKKLASKVEQRKKDLYESKGSIIKEEKIEVKEIHLNDSTSPTPKRFEREYREEVNEIPADDIVKRIHEAAASEAISTNKEVHEDNKQLNQSNVMTDYKPEIVHSALQLPEENKEESSTEEVKEVVETEVKEETVEEEPDKNPPSWDNPTVVDNLVIKPDNGDQVSENY